MNTTIVDQNCSLERCYAPCANRVCITHNASLLFDGSTGAFYHAPKEFIYHEGKIFCCKKHLEYSTFETPQNSEKIYVSIDIEKAGKEYDDALLAVGLVAVKVELVEGKEDEVIAKETVCFPVPPIYKFEIRCWNEFWNHPEHPLLDVLEKIRQNAEKTEEDAAKKVIKFLDDIEAKYPKNQITFVTDNALFDLGGLEYVLRKHGKITPIRYTKDSVYRWIVDPSERLEILGLYKEVKEIVNKHVKHDHWPENDAMFNALMMKYCDKIQKKLESMESLKKEIMNGL